MNQLQFQACTQVLQSLHGAGIATLVLKGAALLCRYYPDQGVRPMGDFDVLVPKRQVVQAIEVLDQLGWQPAGHPREALTPAYFAIRHAQGFANPAGRQLDLHWHVLVTSLSAETDSHFWDAAIPLEVHSVATQALNPTDQLLHVCVHGIAWAPVPPVRWVADALTVLRAAQTEIDWNRLVSMAQRAHCSLQLSAALSYLVQKFDAAVPQDILQTLAQAPVSAAERKLFEAATRRSTLLGMLPVYWRRYQLHLAERKPLGLARQWLGFPYYIGVYQGKKDIPQVFQWSATRIVKRLVAVVMKARS
jgi:hypothetical protein